MRFYAIDWILDEESTGVDLLCEKCLDENKSTYEGDDIQEVDLEGEYCDICGLGND